MQHFHIIAEIMNPLTQDPCAEQSTRDTSEQVDEAPETKQQIPEDALLVHFVKRRKQKKEVTKEILSN